MRWRTCGPWSTRPTRSASSGCSTCPSAGVGDASVAKLDALAAAEGVGFVDAMRHADDAGVTGPAIVASSRSSACSTSSARWSASRREMTSARRPAAGGARPIGLPRRAGGRGLGRVRRAAGEPRRAGRIGARVHPARRVPRAGRAGRRHRRHHRRRPGRADDAALGQGPGVPRRVPRRCGGGRVPARPSADRARRAGGGAPARLRRHHPCPAAAVPHPRVEPQPVRATQYNPPSRFLEEIPGELVESRGNITGRSAYGRQSLRPRTDWGAPPPYRAGAAAPTTRDASAAQRRAPRASRRGRARRRPAQRTGAERRPRHRAADRRRRRAPVVRRGRDHRHPRPGRVGGGHHPLPRRRHQAPRPGLGAAAQARTDDLCAGSTTRFVPSPGRVAYVFGSATVSRKCCTASVIWSIASENQMRWSSVSNRHSSESRMWSAM